MTVSQRTEPRRWSHKRRRRGAIAVLAALFMVILLAMVAFAVDVGYLLVAKTDLQRAADAAAHAAVLEYRSGSSADTVLSKVRTTAIQYVEDNKVLNKTATVSTNWYTADPNGDIVVGKIDFDHPRNSMTFGDVEEYNAVRVRIRRTANRNGEVFLFFARIMGHDSLALEAEATAAIIENVGGFKVPASGENVPFLPITIHKDYWEAGLDALNDGWAFDPVSQTVTVDADGIPEVTLFPNSTESAGNFGTVNVGVSANSASYLGKQIRNGLSQSDLDYHGGELKLNDGGELSLSGNPGLSYSIKDDLEAIAGKPVIIPLYADVSGNGNTGVFTIVKFVGVRVIAVNLTGGDKCVIVQPANVTFKGTIQANVEGTSEQIYSPPVIVL